MPVAALGTGIVADMVRRAGYGLAILSGFGAGMAGGHGRRIQTELWRNFATELREKRGIGNNDVGFQRRRTIRVVRR
mgnify:CR=1 FL=1